MYMEWKRILTKLITDFLKAMIIGDDASVDIVFFLSGLDRFMVPVLYDVIVDRFIYIFMCVLMTTVQVVF